MSVQYFLDGYNAINQIPSLAERTIREAREGLVRLLETQGLGGSPRNEMTVVFDGQSGIAYPKKPSAIKVLFSSDETADDLIKRIVERVENKKNIYVITDDKALGHSVRDFGAKTLSVKDFFGKKQKSKGIPGTKSLAEPKDISTAVEFKINDELKKIWLD